MKPSELIEKDLHTHEDKLYDNLIVKDRVNIKLLKIIDEFAEDIKYLKSQVNNPFPFCTPPPKVREWEK